MGDGGDELAFHLLVLADLQGHLVNVVHQLPQLVAVPVLHLGAVAPGADALGGAGKHRHRLHHVVDEDEVRDEDQGHAEGRHPDHHQDRDEDLPVRLLQGCHQPENAHHPAVRHDGAGDGEDVLLGLRVLAPEGLDALQPDGVADVPGARGHAGGEVGGGDQDLAAGGEELELDDLLLLKGVGVVGGLLVELGIAAGEVMAEGVRRGLGPLLQSPAHAAVVVLGNAGSHQDHNQDQQHADRRHGVHHPPLPQAPDMQGLALFVVPFPGHKAPPSPRQARRFL